MAKIPPSPKSPKDSEMWSEINKLWHYAQNGISCISCSAFNISHLLFRKSWSSLKFSSFLSRKIYLWFVRNVCSSEAIKIWVILLCTQTSEYVILSLNFQNVLSSFVIHIKCLVLYIVWKISIWRSTKWKIMSVLLMLVLEGRFEEVWLCITGNRYNILKLNQLHTNQESFT